MRGFGFEEMQTLQKELQERYKDKWGGLSPKKGRDKLLWMIGEAGEMADVIKQNGDDAILRDGAVRQHFVEEICDMLMYLNDVMLCYSVTPEEVRTAYLKKHETNMGRW